MQTFDASFWARMQSQNNFVPKGLIIEMTLIIKLKTKTSKFMYHWDIKAYLVVKLVYLYATK